MNETVSALPDSQSGVAVQATIPGETLFQGFLRTVEALPRFHPRRIGLTALRVGATVTLVSLPITLVGMHVGFAIAMLGLALARPPIHRFPGFWFGLAMSAWIALSVAVTMWSSNSMKLMMHWSVVYTWLSLPCAAVAFHDARTRSLALRILCATAGAAALLAAAQFLIGYNPDAKPWHIAASGKRDGFQRVSGFLGGVLTYAVASALIGILLSSRPAAVLSSTARWLGRLGSLVGLVVSCSRLALLGFTAGIGTYLAGLHWRRWWIAAVAILLIAGGSIFVLSVIAPAKWDKLVKMEDSRWQIWDMSIGIVEQNPVFGIGGRQRFQADCKRQIKRMRAAGEKIRLFDVTHAHNNVLVLASEHGIPAAILHLGFLFALIRHRYLRRKEDAEGFRLALALVVAWMVAGQFNNLISQSESAYALYACLAFAFTTASRSPASQPI